MFTMTFVGSLNNVINPETIHGTDGKTKTRAQQTVETTINKISNRITTTTHTHDSHDSTTITTIATTVSVAVSVPVPVFLTPTNTL